MLFWARLTKKFVFLDSVYVTGLLFYPSLPALAPKKLSHVDTNCIYPDANEDKFTGSFHWKCVFAIKALQMKEVKEGRIWQS